MILERSPNYSPRNILDLSQILDSRQMLDLHKIFIDLSQNFINPRNLCTRAPTLPPDALNS